MNLTINFFIENNDPRDVEYKSMTTLGLYHQQKGECMPVQVHFDNVPIEMKGDDVAKEMSTPLRDPSSYMLFPNHFSYQWRALVRIPNDIPFELSSTWPITTIHVLIFEIHCVSPTHNNLSFELSFTWPITTIQISIFEIYYVSPALFEYLLQPKSATIDSSYVCISKLVKVSKPSTTLYHSAIFPYSSRRTWALILVVGLRRPKDILTLCDIIHFKPNPHDIPKKTFGMKYNTPLEKVYMVDYIL